jgi:glutamate--cysteine ligase
MEERQVLRDSVPKLGLDAPVSGGRTLRDIAPQVLDIARSGLAARQRFNAAGDNETGYLSALDEVIATGKTPAERLLDRYHGEWDGNVSRVYAEESF